MKKHLTLVIIILFSLGHNVYSQCEIANPSFENWTVQALELETNNGTFTNDVNLPDDVVSVLRLFLLAFGAFFDSSIGQILVDDPVGFVGMEQSMDASEGNFAVKLQGGYDLNTSDIYSLNSCSEIPDSFFLDVKLVNHTGDIPDSLSIFLAFDQGLSALPETEEDAMNSPSSIFANLVYENDSTYHTIALPVIDNFDAVVDTFYYLIAATTHEESYFVIDNLRFVNDTEPACEVTVEATVEEDYNICMCDDRKDFYFTQTASTSAENAVHVILDENNIIQNIGDPELPYFSEDICFEGSVQYTFLGYEGDIVGLELGANFDDLIGCFEYSPVETISSNIIEDLSFTMARDGVDLPDEDEISICTLDNVTETFSFSSPSTFNSTCFLFNMDTDIIVLQFDIEETTSFLDIDPGVYVLGVLYHDADIIPDFVGEDIDIIESIDEEICTRTTNNSYLINIQEDSESCTSCQITVETTVEQDVPICLCDDRISPYFFSSASTSDQGKHILVDDEDNIVAIGDINDMMFDSEICVDGSLRHTLIGYTGVVQGLEEGGSIDELSGCFELTPYVSLNTLFIEELDFQLSRDGLILDDEAPVQVCLSDDIIETFSFVSASTFTSTVFVFNFDTETIIEQFPVEEVTDFTNLAPAEYAVGVLYHNSSEIPDFVGQPINSIIANLDTDICYGGSNNFYTILVVDSGDNCTSSLQDVSILNDFTIVENPVTDLLQVNYKRDYSSSYSIAIIDVNGKIVLTEKVNFGNQKYTYDVSTLTAGMYLLRIVSEGKQATLKFIKN